MSKIGIVLGEGLPPEFLDQLVRKRVMTTLFHVEGGGGVIAEVDSGRLFRISGLAKRRFKRVTMTRIVRPDDELITFVSRSACMSQTWDDTYESITGIMIPAVRSNLRPLFILEAPAEMIDRISNDVDGESATFQFVGDSSELFVEEE